MEGIVVTATRVAEDRMEVPVTVSVVTREQIDRMGATTLEQALKTVPGLQMGIQGNAYPHIEVRGSRDTKDLAVLINGIPFRQVNGSADLTMIPLNIVERIEFAKGPSSSIWGRGAVAGTLNIITVPQDTSKASTTFVARGGSFDTYGADTRVLRPTDKGYVMVSGGGTTSNGYQDGVGRDAQNAMVTSHHEFSDTFAVDVQALLSNVNADRGSTIPIVDGKPMAGVTREENHAIDGACYDGRYQSVTISPTLSLSENVKITNDLTFTQFDSYATGGTTVLASQSNKGWWVSDSDQRAFHNDLRMTLDHTGETVDNTFLVGTYVEIASQDKDAPGYSWSGKPKYGPPNWDTPLTNVGQPATGAPTGTTVKSEFEQTVYSAYAQDTLAIGDVSLMAGIRYDHFHEELTTSNKDVEADQSDSAFSPRVGATWNAFRVGSVQTAFFATYAEGFRTQFPKLSTKNNKTLPQILDPEETKSYEAGVKFSSGNTLFAQVSCFRTEKKGPRSFRTSTDDFLFTNTRTEVDGVEAEISCRITDAVSAWGHYAYHDARYEEFTDTSGNSFEGNRVRMSPEHMAGIGANLATDFFNWNVSANYVGERNLRDNTTGNLHTLDDYITVNTAVTVPVKNLSFQVAVHNLFDEYYIADDFSSKDAGYPGEPRSVTVSLRADF